MENTKTHDYEVGGYSDVDVLYARKNKSVNPKPVEIEEEDEGEDPFDQMMEDESKTPTQVFNDDDESDDENNAFLEEAVKQIPQQQ